MMALLEIETHVKSVSILTYRSSHSCRCCQQTIAEAFHPPRTALTLSELRVVLIRCWNARRSVSGLPLIDDEGFEIAETTLSSANKDDNTKRSCQ